MKTCPVCRSRCFDDMPVCYGCLHDFEREFLIKDAIDNLDEDAEDMPEEAVLPQSSPQLQDASSVSQAHRESNAACDTKDMQNAVATPNTATIKLPSLDTVGVRSFGASGSAAAENKSHPSALELPIPMLTSVDAHEQNRMSQRCNTQSKSSWATGQGECDGMCCGGVASKRYAEFNGASPWLTIETGEGYRLVFRFEPV